MATLALSIPTPFSQGCMVWISVKGEATGGDREVQSLPLPPRIDLSCIPALEMGSRWWWSGEGR